MNPANPDSLFFLENPIPIQVVRNTREDLRRARQDSGQGLWPVASLWRREHCLLLISFGKSRFKYLTIGDQLFMTFGAAPPRFPPSRGVAAADRTGKAAKNIFHVALKGLPHCHWLLMTCMVSFRPKSRTGPFFTFCRYSNNFIKSVFLAANASLCWLTIHLVRQSL